MTLPAQSRLAFFYYSSFHATPASHLDSLNPLSSHSIQLVSSRSTKLSKLDVSDNGIGESGGSALGYLLSFSRPLKQADFSWNSVRAAGAIAIAEGLKLSSLVRVRLNCSTHQNSIMFEWIEHVK